MEALSELVGVRREYWSFERREGWTGLVWLKIEARGRLL
jgi:hypothetical protein